MIATPNPNSKEASGIFKGDEVDDVHNLYVYGLCKPQG